MKIVRQFPPNIEKIKAKFKLSPGIVFTYGDTIYNPYGGPIDTALEVHETTHMHQQGIDPEGWYEKYLSDPKFRLSQEVEAYRNQYKRLERNVKDPFKLEQHLVRLAGDLSGDMYGHMISFEEALEVIHSK